MGETFNNGMNERGFTVQDYKDSISAEDTNEMFTLAYQWQDKKHRHIWDLCNWIEQLQAENKRLMQDILRVTKEGIPADEALVDIQSIIEGFYNCCNGCGYKMEGVSDD